MTGTANASSVWHCSPALLAEQAADAVRALNHLTRPAAAELTGPGDVYDLLAALAAMSCQLPQLLTQLGRWLDTEHAASRLQLAGNPCARTTDAVTTDAVTTYDVTTDDVITAARACLTQAADAAEHLERALDAAQQHVADLAPHPNQETVL
jgi:hypothetical protein